MHSAGTPQMVNARGGNDMHRTPPVQHQEANHHSHHQNNCCFTSPQQLSYTKEDDLNNALLMGYGGIYLGRDLLSILESTPSSSSSPHHGSSESKSRPHAFAAAAEPLRH